MHSVNLISLAWTKKNQSILSAGSYEKRLKSSHLHPERLAVVVFMLGFCVTGSVVKQRDDLRQQNKSNDKYD